MDSKSSPVIVAKVELGEDMSHAMLHKAIPQGMNQYLQFVGKYTVTMPSSTNTFWI